MKIYLIPFAALGVLLSTTASAQEPGDMFATASANLAGDWSGYLEYRDYQSCDIARIPHERSITLPPDASYVVTQLAFSDPGQRIYAGEIATISENTIELAFVRGGTMEVESYVVSGFQTTATGWTTTLTASGYDAGAPADIRIVYTLDGETLTLEKMVQPEGDDAHAFRNRVVLERQ